MVRMLNLKIIVTVQFEKAAFVRADVEKKKGMAGKPWKRVTLDCY